MHFQLSIKLHFNYFKINSTQEIDKKLGLIQQIFELSGNEVRSLTAKEPRLITCQLHKIKVAYLLITLHLQNQIGTTFQLKYR